MAKHDVDTRTNICIQSLKTVYDVMLSSDVELTALADGPGGS